MIDFLATVGLVAAVFGFIFVIARLINGYWG